MVPHRLVRYRTSSDFCQTGTVEDSAGRREQLEVHLLATARAVRRAYDTRLAELDLHMTESGLLQILAIDGPLSQTELATRLHIGRSATGSFIDGLLGRGLIRRDRDPGDGRVWRITNTPAGASMAAVCVTVNEEVLRGLRAELTRTDQRQLFALLAQVRTNADRLDGG